MEKLIFFGLVIPIFIFVLYLGGRAIMTGFGAKSTNKSNLKIDTNELHVTFRHCSLRFLDILLFSILPLLVNKI